MASRRVRALLLILLLALTAPACTPRTRVQEAGTDQEITRDILWRYRSDIRFADIRVSCEDRNITLEGRVSDSKSASDALQIALNYAQGGKVSNKLRIAPR